MTDTNWIADRNPFSLAKPPSWWLRGLAVFDRDLVLLPSRRAMLFVLARRRRLSRSMGAAVDRKLAIADPSNTLDSALCDTHSLVYVTSIVCTGEWTQQNLALTLDTLKRRDTWTHPDGGRMTESEIRAAAFEGGSKLAKQLDRQDLDDRATIDREVRADLYHASGDAWRSRQARRGERVLNAGRPSTLTPRVLATPRPMPTGRLIGV